MLGEKGRKGRNDRMQREHFMKMIKILKQSDITYKDEDNNKNKDALKFWQPEMAKNDTLVFVNMPKCFKKRFIYFYLLYLSTLESLLE